MRAAGAIGVEFAHLLRAYGVGVTLVEFLGRIAPLEDEEVSTELAKRYRRLGIDVLPNKRVLVPCFGEDRVTEYDAAGRVLWEAAVPGPASAERLPDGHTLVGCTAPSQVVELDRTGRVVWQHESERAILQATRR